MIIIRNTRAQKPYVAAILENTLQVKDFLAEVPPKLAVDLEIILAHLPFPFEILESKELPETFRFYNEIPPFIKDRYKVGIVYPVSKPFFGNKGQDYMGALDHEHFGE